MSPALTKMIELFLYAILPIVAIIIISSFFTGESLFFNLVLLGLLLILLSNDLKKEELHKYYLISLFLTAIMFILSNTKPIAALLNLFSKASLTLFVAAFVFIYILAHISKLADEQITLLVEKYRK